MACGADHSLCLTAAGVVWAWGDNEFGQCAGGDVENSLKDHDQVAAPRPLEMPEGAGKRAQVRCVSARACDGTNSKFMIQNVELMNFGDLFK